MVIFLQIKSFRTRVSIKPPLNCLQEEINEHIKTSLGIFMDLTILTDGEKFGEPEKLILDGFCLSCLQTKDNRIWMDQMHWYCYYR